jgi:hypothetical protein
LAIVCGVVKTLANLAKRPVELGRSSLRTCGVCRTRYEGVARVTIQRKCRTLRCMSQRSTVSNRSHLHTADNTACSFPAAGCENRITQG